MKTIWRRAQLPPDLRHPSPPGEGSIWEAAAVIVLGLVITTVGMTAALLAFAEKIDAPRPPDPWGVSEEGPSGALVKR